MSFTNAIATITVHNNSTINGNFKEVKPVEAPDLDKILSEVKGNPDKKLLACNDYINARKRTEISMKRTPKDYYALYDKDVQSRNHYAQEMLSKFSRGNRL